MSFRLSVCSFRLGGRPCYFRDLGEFVHFIMLKLKYKVTKVHKVDWELKRGDVCTCKRNNVKSKALKDLRYYMYQSWYSGTQFRIQIQLNNTKTVNVCVTYKTLNCPVASI